jgi:hypothetical protein
MIAIPIVAMAITAAGAAAKAYGDYRAGQAQSTINKYNAGLAQRAGIDAIQRGGVEASKAEMQTSSLIGHNLATAGGSGVDVQSGSVIDALGSTRLMGQWNAESIRANAQREAAGDFGQGQNYLAQGSMARWTAGYGAAASLLTGTSQTIQSGYNSGLIKFGS